jgi:hypothetical protein
LRFHTSKYLSYTHQDGHVAIVPAGMHHTRLLSIIGGRNSRFERQVYPLSYGEGIHVGTKGDHRSGLTPTQNAHYSCSGHPFLYLNTQGAQVVGYHFSSTRFFVAQFRVLVDVASPVDYFGFDGRGFLVDAWAQLTLPKDGAAEK